MSDFAQIRFQPNRPLLRELSADRLNTILQEIKRNKPKGERGITVRQDGTGTYIGLAASLPRGGGASTPTTRQPWDLIARVDPDADPNSENPPYIVSVQPGTLNGFLPTNWNEEGGGKDVVCQSDGTLYYAKAVVATNGQSMTSVEIVIDEEPPTEQQPQEFGIEATIEIAFGLFAGGQVFRLIGEGNISASPKLWLTTERQIPPAAGELPFSQYFFFR
jgi:hypothetical protein